jgi:hypothetical protein
MEEAARAKKMRLHVACLELYQRALKACGRADARMKIEETIEHHKEMLSRLTDQNDPEQRLNAPMTRKEQSWTSTLSVLYCRRGQPTGPNSVWRLLLNPRTIPDS